MYVDRIPVWTGSEYADPDTGEVLPTWREAVANLRSPAHLMRLGDQFDMRGIIAPSAEADRTVRYLTKYLTKAITDPLAGESRGMGESGTSGASATAREILPWRARRTLTT